MRQPSSVPSVLRYLVILLALTFTARAYADDRSEARMHYQAGVKFYSGGDYRAAIREFSAAQQRVPADLNNYNLALCYDKLGDAEPAIQYYRAFLERQPGTDKRAEIEASVSRLEAASRSAASKKADEAKRAEAARPPVGPVLGPSPAPAAVPAGPAAPVLGPSPAPTATGVTAPAGSNDARKRPAGNGPAVSGPAAGVAVGGSIGTPSTATHVPTGDAQLDRVSAINIDQIRDQRIGGAASGLPAGPDARRAGPAVAANDQGQAIDEPGPAAGPTGPSASSPNAAAPPAPLTGDQPKRATPVYKKWWFWAVVAVSGYVVYELATADSKSSDGFGRGTAPPRSTGMTLLSW